MAVAKAPCGRQRGEEERMVKHLCLTPREIDIVIIVLLAALIALGVGKGGGKLLLMSIKKVFGKDITVNVADKKQCATSIIDPKKCPLHESEHERSMRNEKMIDDLKSDLQKTRGQLFSKLEIIEGMIVEIKVAMAQIIVVQEFNKKKEGA